MALRFPAAALAGMVAIVILGGVLYGAIFPPLIASKTTNLWTLKLTLIEPFISR